MKAMIDDLLDYSRLQTRAEDAQAIELAHTLDLALKTLAPRIEETQARVDVEGRLPAVRWEPAQFERALPEPDLERAEVPGRRDPGGKRLG